MQALGLIETKGLIAAIESADAMLKAADVRLFDKTIVGGGLVSIAVTGDVAAVKAAVEAGGAAVRMLSSTLLISEHVIPRPSGELDSIIGPKDPQDPEAEDPVAEETAAEETLIVEEPAPEDPETAEVNEAVNEAVNEEFNEEKDEAAKDKAYELHRRDDIDRMVLECGLEETLGALGKMKVIELRNLARRYMDFGITGRAVSKADKKLLMAEFRKYYGHK
jgi:microcompartment protein CcmL/EutN